MINTDNLPESAINLIEQFSSPLDDIEPEDIGSEQRAYSLLEQISKTLVNTDEWTVRCETIQRCMALLKGNITNFESIDYSQLKPGINACILDSRATVVRWSSLFCAACAQKFKCRFNTSVDIIFISLCRQLPHAVPVVSDSCHLSILEIARNVPHRKVMRNLMVMSCSRVGIVRHVSAEAFQLIIQSWTILNVNKFANNILACLQTLERDPNYATRRTAKLALADFQVYHLPNRKFNPIDILLRSNQNNINKAPSISPKPRVKYHRNGSSSRSSIRGESDISHRSKARSLSAKNTDQRSGRTGNYYDIGDNNSNADMLSNGDTSSFRSTMSRRYLRNPRISRQRRDDSSSSVAAPKKVSRPDFLNYITPIDASQARELADYLTDVVENEDWDVFDGKESLLPQTIINGYNCLPNMDIWEPCLRPLISHYKDVFRPELKEMLREFDNDERFIKILSDIYDADELCEPFMSSNDKENIDFLKKFARVAEDNNIELPARIRNHISRLFRNNNDAVDSGELEEYILGKDDVDTVVDRIIEGIRDGHSLGNLVHSLSEKCDERESLQNLNEKLFNRLNDLFKDDTDGNRETINNTFAFIEELMSYNPRYQFFSSLEDIIRIIVTGDKLLKERAIHILALLIQNEKTLLELYELVNSLSDESAEIQVALQAISTRLEEMNPDEIEKYVNITCEYFIPLLNSDVVAVRRLATSCFVQLHIKATELFAPYFSKLSIMNQKLIKLRVRGPYKSSAHN